MNVELRYLHAFRAVCEGGSLRAAAASLHRTEQAVSYQLRKLEEALGMPLFHRGQGPLVPNAAGERLLVFCREMGGGLARLHEGMRGGPTEPRRTAAGPLGARDGSGKELKPANAARDFAARDFINAAVDYRSAAALPYRFSPTGASGFR